MSISTAVVQRDRQRLYIPLCCTQTDRDRVREPGCRPFCPGVVITQKVWLECRFPLLSSAVLYCAIWTSFSPDLTRAATLAATTITPEPAWHRRARARRSWDRALVRVDAARQRLSEHHSAQRQLSTSTGGTAFMGKDGGGPRQKKSGVWWPCACGSWAWADKKVCPKCKAPCPRWCQAYQGATKSSASHGNGARGAASNAPATIVVGDFVVPGKGNKNSEVSQAAPVGACGRQVVP